MVNPDLEGDPEYLGSTSESDSVTNKGGKTNDVEILNIEVSPNLPLILQSHDPS